MKNKIALYGRGGHAAVIASMLDYCDIAYYEGAAEENQGIEQPVIVAVGDNATRKKIVDGLDAEFAQSVSYEGPISGIGSVVMRGAIIQARVTIGDHAIINTGATVDHDCTIGDFAHIAPGVNLCGDVKIGEGALIGVGASVIPGISIGKWATVGAGAAVVRDVPDGETVVGIPAEPIKLTKEPS